MNTKSWISTNLLSASSLPLPPFISSHLPPLASVLHEFHSSELAQCVQMFVLSFFGLREAQPEVQRLFLRNINTLREFHLHTVIQHPRSLLRPLWLLGYLFFDSVLLLMGLQPTSQYIRTSWHITPFVFYMR